MSRGSTCTTTAETSLDVAVRSTVFISRLLPQTIERDDIPLANKVPKLSISHSHPQTPLPELCFDKFAQKSVKLTRFLDPLWY
jgi:hypothetical protein